MMINRRFHLPVLLSSTANFIYFYFMALILSSQIIPLSSSKSYSLISNITQLIENYLCQTYVHTCYFRARHHSSFTNQLEIDNCKSFLILHSCLHHDTDTQRVCDPKILKQTRFFLDKQTPKDCFTSSVYKTFYAKHLRSIAPSRTIVKCQIFVLFSLLISFIIKIRAPC